MFDVVNNLNLLVFNFFYGLSWINQLNTPLSFLSFFLCWSALIVPLYYLLFYNPGLLVGEVLGNINEEQKKEYVMWHKKRALKILIFLVALFFALRFFEKGILDNIIHYNTVPSWRGIIGHNWLECMEMHKPYPSLISGHILKMSVLWFLVYNFYHEHNVKIAMIVCFISMAVLRMYQTMHTPIDIICGLLMSYALYRLIKFSISLSIIKKRTSK